MNEHRKNSDGIFGEYFQSTIWQAHVYICEDLLCMERLGPCDNALVQSVHPGSA